MEIVFFTDYNFLSALKILYSTASASIASIERLSILLFCVCDEFSPFAFKIFFSSLAFYNLTVMYLIEALFVLILTGNFLTSWVCRLIF